MNKGTSNFEPYRVPGSATQYIMPTITRHRTVRARTARTALVGIVGIVGALAVGLIFGIAVGHPGTRIAPAQCVPASSPQSTAVSSC